MMIKRIVRAGSSLLLLFAAKIFKFSPIMGTKYSWFSALNFLAPMTGILGGPWSLWLVALGRVLVASLVYRLAPGLAFLHFLPQVSASYYWTCQLRWLRMAYAAVCMIIFTVASSQMYGWDSGAALYSSLWLLPLLIGCWRQPSAVWLALGSTMTAHATGSLIWLATVPMSAGQWLSLIPIALVERTLFAAGLYLIYAGATAWQLNRSSLAMMAVKKVKKSP